MPNFQMHVKCSLWSIITDNATNKVYIMMEVRLEALFKKPEEYTILERLVVFSVEFP